MDEQHERVIELLERVRRNSIRLSEYHRKRFYYYKSYTKYFDLPVLVLSVMSSSFSVGTQHYLNQRIISAVVCAIGVLVSIITSAKLYLNLEDNKQVELKMSKDFYTLALDIYRFIVLTPEDRGQDPVSFLSKCYSQYIKLIESSNLLNMKMKNDMLTDATDHVPHLKKQKDIDLFSIGPSPPHRSSTGSEGETTPSIDSQEGDTTPPPTPPMMPILRRTESSTL